MGLRQPLSDVGYRRCPVGAGLYPPFALSLGAEFKLDSWLIIADSPEVIREFYGGSRPEAPLFTHSRYYLWTGSELTLVGSVNAW